MKKIFMAALMAVCAFTANAQDITVWYGANIASMSTEGTSPDSEFKALNIGVSYTAPINDMFDWSAGAGYVTKGCKDWDPGYLQIEGNAAYNFVKNDGLKVGAFTGPAIGMMIAKDDAEETKALGLGWQLGVGATISKVVVKAGYELGLTDCAKGGKSKLNGVFVRVGYNF